MLIVEYNPNQGCCFRDGEVIDKVREDWQTAVNFENRRINNPNDPAFMDDYVRDTSSELYITALRMLVARGEIDHKSVRIFYRRAYLDAVELRIDRYGQLSDWPKGFCDTNEKLLVELIALQGKAYSN